MAVKSLANSLQEPQTRTERDPILALIHDRTERGLRFFQEYGGEFVEVAPGIVRVPSRSGRGFYDVDTVNEKCQCGDYSFRVSVRRASRKDRTTKPSNNAKSGMSEKLSSEWWIASVTVTR
jgi:hypothetical protein